MESAMGSGAITDANISYSISNAPAATTVNNAINGTTQTSADLTQFDIYFGIWIPGIICIFGILGNILVLIVLSRDRENVLFKTLKALACSDMILLLAGLFQQVIPMFCLMTESEAYFCRMQGYIRVYMWPTVCIAQMVSVYLVVLVSAERFVAIVIPLRARFIFNKKTVQYCVAGICIFSVVFNFPKFFEFFPERNRDPATNLTTVTMGVTYLRRNQVYRYLYNTGLNCIVLYALPLTALTILSLKTVLKIHQSNRQWEQLNRCQQKEVKATKLPLVIVAVFFICGAQSLLAFILDAIYLHTLPWLQYYTAVVNLLVMLNSAINCILMYLFGRKFRLMFIDTLLCGRGEHKWRYKSSIRKHTYTYTSVKSKRCTKGDEILSKKEVVANGTDHPPEYV